MLQQMQSTFVLRAVKTAAAQARAGLCEAEAKANDWGLRVEL